MRVCIQHDALTVNEGTWGLKTRKYGYTIYGLVFMFKYSILVGKKRRRLGEKTMKKIIWAYRTTEVWLEMKAEKTDKNNI